MRFPNALTVLDGYANVKLKATFLVIGAILVVATYVFAGKSHQDHQPRGGIRNWDIDKDTNSAGTLSLNSRPTVVYSVYYLESKQFEYTLFTLGFNCPKLKDSANTLATFRTTNGESVTLEIQLTCTPSPELESAISDLNTQQVDTLFQGSGYNISPLEPNRYYELFTRSILLEISLPEIFDIDSQLFFDISSGKQITQTLKRN